MAITALPDSTIHLLGSAQALTTPTSLVKELVDNALDAKATSVDILISPNTIDKIEVRDNGHGIAQEDLDSLGRRGHTSKLRSFDELKSIGGVSLGFRGEALASAVQLGVVSVTTRTEGETVATCVHLQAPGGIASQSRTSHPIGTKVSVAKFLYSLPVRKQTAEKESTKTLKKIKELLQSYAFARPKVRFCLKVSSNGKGSWSFTPRPNDGLKEVASQIIGRDAAAQCIEQSISFSDKSSRDLQHEGDDTDAAQLGEDQSYGSGQFFVEMFLPKPKATILGHGQYISIDARPVSHDKGTMRKVVSIYKYYAKSSILEGDEKLRDPFLRLNIRCPVSSYDPNVEPAKNDVIFQNEPLILESIEQLFKDVYGVPVVSSTAAIHRSSGIKSDDFELLMSRNNDNQKTPTSIDHIQAVQNAKFIPPAQTLALDKAHEPSLGGDLLNPNNEIIEEEASSERRKWNVDMSEDFSEVIEDDQRPHRPSRKLGRTQQPVSDIPASPGNPLNPWIISKMTAPIRPKNIVALPTVADPVPLHAASQARQTYLPTPHHSSDPVLADVESLSLFRTAPPRHIGSRDGLSDLAPPSLYSSTHGPQQGPEQPLIHPPNDYPMIAESDDDLLLGDDSEPFRRNNDFHSARAIFDGPMQKFPRSSGPKKSRGVNTPFVAPLRADHQIAPQDGLRQITLGAGVAYPTSTQKDRSSTHLDRDQNDELAWAMDFEHRKENATRQRRKEILAARAAAEAEPEISATIIRRRRQQPSADLVTERDHTDDTIRSSPHKNRYNAAIANLEANKAAPGSNEPAKPFLKTSLPDGDPRAYLMRRQKSMLPSVKGGPPKPMRAKSTRLPLERIPEAQNMHNVLLNCSVSIDKIQDVLQKISGHDMYVQGSSQCRGLRMTSSDAKLVQRRSEDVIEKWMERCEKEDEVEYMFENLIHVD
ncbi:hypothetical protein VTL71DRAFT_11856 [Oculimacula yallundae]|uniref:DNA mismatch repair protein S5 domain-containing protein n=1 Tax=Oculimacula yallundae TaxID=86028 RepID=A0ABR4CR85_9HELO